jgi:hypothetical protein
MTLSPGYCSAMDSVDCDLSAALAVNHRQRLLPEADDARSPAIQSLGNTTPGSSVDEIVPRSTLVSSFHQITSAATKCDMASDYA